MLSYIQSLYCLAQLTYEDSYQTIEKIKVVGSTYMAACGLLPAGDELSEEESSMKENVSTIAKFAASMFEKLEIFNAEGFMELQLRVGKSLRSSSNIGCNS